MLYNFVVMWIVKSLNKVHMLKSVSLLLLLLLLLSSSSSSLRPSINILLMCVVVVSMALYYSSVDAASDHIVMNMNVFN